MSAAEPLSALRALSSHNNYNNYDNNSVKLFAFQTFVDDIFHENFNVFCRFFFVVSLDACVPVPVRIWDINICRPLAFNTGLWAWHRGGGQAAARLSLSRKTFSYEMRFVMKVELQNAASQPAWRRRLTHFQYSCAAKYTHTHTRAQTSLHAM